MTRVVVVGGGVAGLTVAHRLVEGDPSIEVAVLEATERPGGKLADVEVRGVRVPAGADAFVARKPWAVDLCRDLGLELVAPASSGAWLWTPAGLVPYPADTAFGIPGDPGSVFRWPGLSGRGRRRALRDLLIRTRRDPAEETLGALLRRRLGDEATDRADRAAPGRSVRRGCRPVVRAGDVPRAGRVGARAGLADPWRAGRDAQRARR